MMAYCLNRAGDDLARLDTAMENKYRGDPATLAAWKKAIRLERGPRNKKETPTPQK